MRPGSEAATKLGMALVVLAVILAGSATPSQAQWSFSAEFLYWEPIGFDTKVAVQNQTGGGFGVGQTGKLEGTDFGFTPAFRVSAGWNPFRVTWTRLSSGEDQKETCGPVVSSTRDCLAATNAINFGSFNDTVKIKSHLRFDMVDLDFRPLLVTTQNLTAHWVLGLRYVGLQQKIREFARDTFDDFQENIDATMTNTMLGLKIGVDGRYAVPWVQGLGVEGNLALSLLKGNFRGHFNHAVAFGDICNSVCASEFAWDEKLKKDTITPGTDLQFRLVYTTPQMKNLDLWIGYDFLYFVNALASVQVGNFDLCGSDCGVPQIQQDKSVGFHGMNVGARWRF